jgi:two-component sensor histidine kinase
MALKFARTSDSPPFNLVAEANHRIANHLSMIAALLRLQGGSLCKKETLSGPEVQLVLTEFGGRLETVAKVHRLLAHGQNGAPIDLAEYLRDTADGIVRGLSVNGNIRLHFDFRAEGALPPDKVVLLGLLVGELVTNSVKYAHPAGVAGTIQIESSRRDDGGLVIEVSDDGVGLPEGLDPLKNSGMGFRIMRAFASQLGATISFNNYGLGLNCILRMPHVVPPLKVVS